MTGPLATPAASRAHPFRHALLLGALAAFASLSIDMYLPAFPQIGRDFRAPIGSVEMTLSIFLAGMALGQLLHGALSDRYGRRVLLQAGTALFAASSAGCALAGSIHALMAWRLFMALGGSAGQAVSRAIVRDWFHEHESARYFSILMGITGAAPILAPFLGGQILRFAGWRAIFALLAGFGGLCLVGIGWILPESLPPERRTRTGMGQALRLYGRLLADLHFAPRVIALGCAYGAMFSYITGSSAVFIVGYGISAQHFGLFFGANSCGLIAATQVNRVLLRRHAPRTILAGAYSLLLVFTALLAVAGWTGAEGLWLFSIVLFAAVSMFGFIYPNGAALSLGRLGSVAGSASALYGLAQFGIGSAGGALVSYLRLPAPLPMTLPMVAFALAGYAILWLSPASVPAKVPEPSPAG